MWLSGCVVVLSIFLAESSDESAGVGGYQMFFGRWRGEPGSWREIFFWEGTRGHPLGGEGTGFQQSDREMTRTGFHEWCPKEKKNFWGKSWGEVGPRTSQAPPNFWEDVLVGGVESPANFQMAPTGTHYTGLVSSLSDDRRAIVKNVVTKDHSDPSKNWRGDRYMTYKMIWKFSDSTRRHPFHRDSIKSEWWYHKCSDQGPVGPLQIFERRCL